VDARALFDVLDLRNITLVVQDWGALIGLRLAAEHPDRFRLIVVANGGLPTGDQTLPEAFLRWQRFAQTARAFDAGRVVQNGCATMLSPEVVAAYNAPFPDDSYKEGARIFPSLVPTSPDDPAAPATWQRARCDRRRLPGERTWPPWADPPGGPARALRKGLSL
jgi:haloalkane dehalogenase